MKAVRLSLLRALPARWRALPARWRALPARRWLALILLGALALRLGFIVAFGHTLQLEASGYDVYAVHLLQDGRYTRFDDREADSDLPPLYIVTLVVIYSLLGRSAASVALVQTGFDLLTITLIYLIGRRAFPRSAAPALLGAAFTAFYPYLLFQDLSTNDTAIFLLLLAAGVWGAYRAAEASLTPAELRSVSPSPPVERGPGGEVNRGVQRDAPTVDAPTRWRPAAWAAFIGLAFGLAALTKTVIALLGPCLALWWARRVGLRQALLLTAITAGVALAVLAPWVARNTALHGELVLTSTNDGSNLHQGNNRCTADYLANGWDVQWINCYPPMPEGLDEIAQAAWHRTEALRWLRENPGAWPRHFGQKFLTLWNPQITPYQVPPQEVVGPIEFVDDAVFLYESAPFQVARAVHMLYFAPLLALGLLGWWAAARQGERIGPLLGVLVMITVAYLIFHPSTRYRMPADPFLFLLSGYAVAWLWGRLRVRGGTGVR